MAPYAYVYSMCQTLRSRSLCVRHCSGRFTNIVVAVNTTWIKKESVLPPRFSFWVWRTSIVLWRCSYIPSWINDENDKARGPWPLLCLYTQRIWEGASSVVSVLLGTLMLLSQAPPWWPHLTSITSLLHTQWYRKLRLHRMKLGGHLQSVPKNLLNASHHLNQLKKIKLEILAPRTRPDWGRKERFKNGFWVFFFVQYVAYIQMIFINNILQLYLKFYTEFQFGGFCGTSESCDSRAGTDFSFHMHWGPAKPRGLLGLAGKTGHRLCPPWPSAGRWLATDLLFLKFRTHAFKKKK